MAALGCRTEQSTHGKCGIGAGSWEHGAQWSSSHRSSQGEVTGLHDRGLRDARCLFWGDARSRPRQCSPR